MVNPLLLDPETEEIAATQLVSPQLRLAPSPPDVVVPEKMIEPVCPMLSRIVITFDPEAAPMASSIHEGFLYRTPTKPAGLPPPVS